MTLHSGHQFIELDTGKLEASLFSSGEEVDTSIVLLHEGLGSIEMWRDFPVTLSQHKGHHVVAYSRFGYGQSDRCTLPRPLDYMEREAMDVLPLVLDHVASENIYLLGHSDGGSISAIYAGAAPDPRLRGIVLVAPHFFTEPIALEAIRAATAAYEHGSLRDQLKRYHGNNVDIAFRGWNDAWLDPAFRQWDISGYLETIHCPTMIIQGNADQYGTVAQVDRAAQRIPSAVQTHMLDHCRHAPHLEQPDRLLALIKQFIADSQP